MIGAIREPEQKWELAKTLGKALFECLLETEELFFYVLIPVACVVAVCVVGVMVYHIGVVVYDLTFDPYATNVAATLDSLSIDPDKWVPRV